MISKPNISSVMVNCLTRSEMIKGKNGKSIINNKWRKFDDADKYSWREVSRFCKVKGGY
jgi:hypothetical protein